MFRKATSGTDSNNRKFSTCSRDYISAVLQTKAASCFKRKYYQYIFGGDVIQVYGVVIVVFIMSW
jgi:hypothetical protein